MSSLRWLLVVVLLSGLGGCITQQKLPYLQNESYSTKAPVAVANTAPAYRLQESDVLSVKVQSTQAEQNNILNITGSQSLFSAEPGVLYLSGYEVDSNGEINLPTVGKVKVKGLTLTETQARVQKAVGAYVRDATVLVKLLSFRVTVLGEVRAPGRYFVYNSQATLLEALGLAGDLTEFGNRENVKLIRQTPTGSETILINLTDPNLLQSPYYYLAPNDALYVEPLKARAARANFNNLALVFSGISAIVLVLSFLTR